MLRSLSHLTARDLLIADWLDQHGVLTTAQISQAHFSNITTASHRLAKLRAIGLLDRFHRPLPGGGFGPWHWVIGALGAQLIAAARETTPPTPRQLAQRHARLAASLHLPHRLGANQFFIDLHTHARQTPGARLVRWWSERDTARRYHQRIHPDGHALWRTNGTTIGVFLEFDTGTEDLTRLTRKLHAYDQLAADGGPTYPVLFWLHSPTREQHLHDVLDQRRRSGAAPAATAVRGAHGPAETVWTLDGHHRLTLTQLPFHHGEPDSMYNPNLHDPTLDQEL
ncbi:MAG TPA: replication-relaxation family protein [Micromonosporaceae bacterium]|nr:replication-relaxation family protein [Micromonosporaceae bacterium]